MAILRDWLDTHPGYRVDFPSASGGWSTVCARCQAPATAGLSVIAGPHIHHTCLCDSHLSQAVRLIADHARGRAAS